MKQLIFILLIVVFLRFFQLSVLPSGLYWDELDTGYQAYSLLMTGRDYFGSTIPAHVHSFADYRSGLYIYLTVPFVKMMQMNSVSVRFTSAIMSAISVIVGYIFAARVLKLGKRSWVLPAAMSLSPWVMIQGRVAAESQLLIPLVLIGLTCFFTERYSVSALFFGLSLWAYPTAKLFIPVLLLFMIFTHRHKLSLIRQDNYRKLVPVLVFLLISSLPLYETFARPVGERFAQLSIFNDPTIAKQVETDRQQALLSLGRRLLPGMSPGLIEKAAFNKITHWTGVFITNYSLSLSTNFLFTEGDPNLRHNLNQINTGQFFLIEIIPFLVGVYILFKTYRSDPMSRFIVLWFLFSPLPAALTTDGGTHAPRLLFLFIPSVIIITLGIRQIFSYPKLAFVISGLFILSLLSSTYYMFTIYRLKSASVFNAGFNQAAAWAIRESNKYDRVILDGFNESMLMAYLFESRYPPAVFQASFPLPSGTIANGVEGYRFGNIFILYPGTRDWNQIRLDGRNLLFVISTQPHATDLNPVGVIPYPDATPAFIVSEIHS